MIDPLKMELLDIAKKHDKQDYVMKMRELIGFKP